MFFGLLIACLGIAVLSQVGNESLSRQMNCSDEKLLEFFHHCKYYTSKVFL